MESYTPGITGLQFKNYNFTGSLFKFWVVCTISRRKTVATDMPLLQQVKINFTFSLVQQNIFFPFFLIQGCLVSQKITAYHKITNSIQNKMLQTTVRSTAFSQHTAICSMHNCNNIIVIALLINTVSPMKKCLQRVWLYTWYSWGKPTSTSAPSVSCVLKDHDGQIICQEVYIINTGMIKNYIS